MAIRNRTIDSTGVQLSGELLNLDPITGTGVDATQAAAIAAPLKGWLDSLPYYLDEQGKIAYKSASIAINHPPVLTYAEGHPLAGQVAKALYDDGAYITMRGGAPMPFIDMDMISPYALEQLLKVLNEILEVQVNAI